MTKTPIAVLGIDLGKNSCSVAGLDMHGAVVLRRGADSSIVRRKLVVTRIISRTSSFFRSQAVRKRQLFV